MIHVFKNQNDVSVQVDLRTIQRALLSAEYPKNCIGLELGPYTIMVKASAKLLVKVLKEAGMPVVPVVNIDPVGDGAVSPAPDAAGQVDDPGEVTTPIE